jgi:hypothetical protein
MFDSTLSVGWIGGAVILGDTGIGMSVRGGQPWLDKTRAAQLRPRARARAIRSRPASCCAMASPSWRLAPPAATTRSRRSFSGER